MQGWAARGGHCFFFSVLIGCHSGLLPDRFEQYIQVIPGGLAAVIPFAVFIVGLAAAFVFTGGLWGLIAVHSFPVALCACSDSIVGLAVVLWFSGVLEGVAERILARADSALVLCVVLSTIPVFVVGVIATFVCQGLSRAWPLCSSCICDLSWRRACGQDSGLCDCLRGCSRGRSRECAIDAIPRFDECIEALICFLPAAVLRECPNRSGGPVGDWFPRLNVCTHFGLAWSSGCCLGKGGGFSPVSHLACSAADQVGVGSPF